jgi:hypothetical protein
MEVDFGEHRYYSYMNGKKRITRGKKAGVVSEAEVMSGREG